MASRRRFGLSAGVLAVAAALALSACSSGNPLSDSAGGEKTAADTIAVGSAAFPENEIIAQIYAQALEAQGVKVTTHMKIGQRAAYLKALDDGSIDLIPEYSGNLLQFYKKGATAQSSEDVVDALRKALPQGLEVLPPAQAQDKDSYTVTKAYAAKHDLTSLGDLAKIGGDLVVAGNAELAKRPYGPAGLKKYYGVSASVLPIEDSGGPNTVKALTSGKAQLADVFTTSPLIAKNDLVTLKDPKNMIIAQNVVPLIRSSKASEKVKGIINKVDALLTTEDLVAMNAKNSGSAKEQPDQIAKEWLTSHDLL